MYAQYIKRVLDIVLSITVLTVFAPLFLLLTVLGAICMGANPFFLQRRPGKDGKVFSIIKFRTMHDTRNEKGELLSDAERQTKYGRILRKTSLDEIPEMINILKGDMSLIGPRPLLEEYLPYYTQEEMHRHDVRPGLTGLAQVRGRNGLSWERRFASDLEYVQNISFPLDLKILFLTVRQVVLREGVADDTREIEGNFAEIRKQISIK